MNPSTERRPILASPSLLLSWHAVAGLDIPFVSLFERLRFPAAVLVGSRIVSITVAVSCGRAHLPRQLFLTAQGFVGCLIGPCMPAPALGEIVAN